MMAKNVGQGSQYLWTYRDRAGDFLRRRQRTIDCKVPAGVTVNNFWSVVVYDAISRSELQNGNLLPSISSYASRSVNGMADPVDIVFGPNAPNEKANWIKTVPGHGVVSNLLDSTDHQRSLFR